MLVLSCQNAIRDFNYVELIFPREPFEIDSNAERCKYISKFAWMFLPLILFWFALQLSQREREREGYQRKRGKASGFDFQRAKSFGSLYVSLRTARSHLQKIRLGTQRGETNASDAKVQESSHGSDDTVKARGKHFPTVLSQDFNRRLFWLLTHACRDEIKFLFWNRELRFDTKRNYDLNYGLLWARAGSLPISFRKPLLFVFRKKKKTIGLLSLFL